jgi:excisionase family DNA binding protein
VGVTGPKPEYLTPGEAARLLHVSPKTLNRWANEGRLACIVTLGGHRRFSRHEVDRIASLMTRRQER